MGIFEDARTAITPALIERLFSVPGAEWRGDEYWTLNPTRGDKTIGSFHISATGLYVDHASGDSGDLIDLIVARDNCTKKQAAELIAGKVADEAIHPQATKKQSRTRSKRAAPMLPIPEEKLKELNTISIGQYYTERYGKPTAGWRYVNADGKPVFAVIRYDKPGSDKSVIPFFYGVDGRWHMGQAYKSGRPLYRLDALSADPALPVLVVEGEKCADVSVPGYVLTTWAGGGNAVSCTDWAPLSDRDVLIWPDADEPGAKCCGAIARRLPHARILRIDSDHPQGWDIADAVAEGIDPLEYIKAHIQAPDQPFRCLGYDSDRYWFLTRNQRLPYSIDKGQFTVSKGLELASLAEWSMLMPGAVTDSGNLKLGAVQDYLKAESEAVGLMTIDQVRGAGVWIDAGRLVINDGRQIITADGTQMPYDQYRGTGHYVASETQFGDMQGPSSTDAEGVKLLELAQLQRWASPYMAVAVIGWALIAPFGGILQWRPHLWVSGRKGTGKSWIIENLIAPLCGPFAFSDSGIGTEPGIRRALHMDARPVILDEMEPHNRHSRERITRILDLARNSASNASSTITMAAGDRGTIRYVIRSCFCCASVNVPDGGAAITSRFVRCELRSGAPSEEQAKIRKSKAAYAAAMAQGPERFRRRIFRDLPKIRRDIEYLRDGMIVQLGEQRRADLLAPVLAAAWAIQSAESVSAEAGTHWLLGLLDQIMVAGDSPEEDEDRVIQHILASHIRQDDSTSRSVAELLKEADATIGDEGANALLSRHGIKLHDYINGDRDICRVIAIATRSDAISKMLVGTPYEHGYEAQIKRHSLCIDADRPAERVYMGIGRVRCRFLEWAGFRSMYMGEKG